MKNLVTVLLACLFISCSVKTSRDKASPADVAEIRKRLKEQATEIAHAVVAEDFEKVADMTHPNSLKMMGGREEVIALQKKFRKETIASGGKIAIERVEDPGDVVESHAVLYSYVPVVARIHCQMPKKVMLMKSIFIAVSQDEGKTWKFVDDSGIPFREIVEQMFPDWPSRLILPPQEAPTTIEK